MVVKIMGNKKYQAVLFAFDGVIAKTMDCNFKAWSYASSQLSIKLDREKYFLAEGKPTIDVA